MTEFKPKHSLTDDDIKDIEFLMDDLLFQDPQLHTLPMNLLMLILMLMMEMTQTFSLLPPQKVAILIPLLIFNEDSDIDDDVKSNILSSIDKNTNDDTNIQLSSSFPF